MSNYFTLKQKKRFRNHTLACWQLMSFSLGYPVSVYAYKALQSAPIKSISRAKIAMNSRNRVRNITG